MRYLITSIILFLIPLSLFSFTDESHYSTTFGMTRFFRVFTPPDYNANDCSKRYPVIYYFHGCGGSYKSSGPYSYADYGLKAPVAIDKAYDPDYEYSSNADFENVVHDRDVIIICVDGKIYDLPGCGVYFPSQADTWNGDYYNFSVYIRELIDVVDTRYNTKRGPQYRAISGLSMGGHTAIWVAAANPHLFSSASEFCHSPQYYDVGDPEYMTTIDVKQLWRNLRGLPFRHTTTDRDYLRYYTSELFSIYSGAGFENEFYLADYCNHHAARVDLQFDFHINNFATSPVSISCFSYVNLYPRFEVRGYEVSSSKTGNGWIYMHSVAKNGLGLYTRKQLPFGIGLPNFDIFLTTPALYRPNNIYTITQYSYQNNSFSSFEKKADSKGRLTLSSNGGMGEEIGIIGPELQPPVFVLSDTINENIYLDSGVESALSFDIVNLSASVQEIDFYVSTENNELLTILSGAKHVSIPAQSKIRVDSLFLCKGNYFSSFQNTGYIKITSAIEGNKQDRECIIQIIIKNTQQLTELSGIKIFDGKSEKLPLFKYAWGKWNEPMSSGLISEGTGNGNGKAEIGEVFSIWIEPSKAFDPTDVNTWHPVIPVNTENNPDISLAGVKQHLFNTGRPVFSAEICLNRKPTEENPVKIPVRAEFLKVQPLENDCHRDAADNFDYFYYNILIFENGTAGMERQLKGINVSKK